MTLRGFWLAISSEGHPAERMKSVRRADPADRHRQAARHALPPTYSVAQIKEAVAAAASGERDGKILDRAVILPLLPGRGVIAHCPTY